MKRLATLLACLVILLPTFARATAQVPDRLQLDGETVSLNTNPLDAYLLAHPDALPEDAVISSANWRGYIATFAVRDEQLVLERVSMRFDNGGKRGEPKEVDVLPRLFPGKKAVPARWYSGTLVIPRGKMVAYVHMGYGSTYERYTLLGIREGRVVERRDLSRDEFERYRNERFAAYKQTAAYAKAFREATSGDLALQPADAERFIRAFSAEEYLSMPAPKAD